MSFKISPTFDIKFPANYSKKNGVKTFIIVRKGWRLRSCWNLILWREHPVLLYIIIHTKYIYIYIIFIFICYLLNIFYWDLGTGVKINILDFGFEKISSTFYILRPKYYLRHFLYCEHSTSTAQYCGSCSFQIWISYWSGSTGRSKVLVEVQKISKIFFWKSSHSRSHSNYSVYFFLISWYYFMAPIFQTF